MIHLALVVAAFLFLAFIALAILVGLLGLVIRGFEENVPCGCIAIVASAVIVVVCIAIVLWIQS